LLERVVTIMIIMVWIDCWPECCLLCIASQFVVLFCWTAVDASAFQICI